MLLLFVMVRRSSLSHEKQPVSPCIQGLKKFDAAKWRSFIRVVDQVREAFADVPAVQLDAMIREAVKSVRRKARRFPLTI